MYDFANSAFTTLIVTFIFSAYFAQVIVGDEVRGTVIWTRAINISAIVVALTMPVLGAIADFSRRKKRFLLLATLQTLVFTALLFFMQPGMVFLAAVLFIFANVAYEGGQAFYNAFLPEISTSKNMGRISGYGWALGYVGGLLALVIALWMMRALPEEAHLNVRATILLVALWFGIFSIPTFLFLRERGVARQVEPGTYVREGFRRVGETFRHLRRYREAGKVLLARLIYNDGLVTIFALAGIYAIAVFGFTIEEVIVLGIVANVAAGAGAFVFGFVNDRIGGKWTIAITLIVLSVAGLVGASAETRTGFWAAAMTISLMVGPAQSASRMLLGSMTPEAKHAEFFGFYAFSGKLSSILGPLLFGTVVGATGSHRLAMGSMVVFFVVGFVLLMLVDEKAGIEAAREGPPLEPEGETAPDPAGGNGEPAPEEPRDGSE